MVLGYLALLGRILLLGYERIVVKKLGHKAESDAATFLFFGMAALFLLPSLFFVSPPKNYWFLLFAAISGVFYTIAFVLYVKSLSTGEVSLVSPLYNFNVFFLLILTVTFLGENLSFYKIVGIILLVYGASFLNKQENIFSSLKSLLKDRACVLMIICSVFVAVGRTVDGFAVRDAQLLWYGFSINAVVAFVLFVYLILTKKLGNAFKLLRRKTRTAVTAGAVNSYSYVLLLFAFTKMEVSIAEPASMLGMIVTVVLARFIFKEKIKNRLLGVVIMILGAWLLFL